MNWVDYRERLGIGFENDEKLQMCINRIRNIIPELDQYYTEDDLFQYMNTVGEEYKSFTNINCSALDFAFNSVCRTKTLKEFISKYVALINSARENCITDDGDRFLSELFEVVLTSTLEKYCIPYDIFRDEDGILIFPKGVPEYDKELISDSLIWLSCYPETEKAWGIALRAYSSGDEPSEVADLFRKTLERFFQNFFNSGKVLEGLKSEYGRYLKEHGIPGEIVANMECLLQQYASFMNNHAKHHDRTNSLILEYIMYQTGNIIRLLIKLADEDKGMEE